MPASSSPMDGSLKEPGQPKRVAVYAAHSPPRTPDSPTRRKRASLPALPHAAGDAAQREGHVKREGQPLGLDHLPLSSIRVSSGSEGVPYMRIGCPFGCWTPAGTKGEYVQVDFISHLNVLPAAQGGASPRFAAACVQAVTLQGHPDGRGGIASFSIVTDSGAGWMRHSEDSFYCAEGADPQRFQLCPPPTCRQMRLLVHGAWGRGTAARLGIEFTFVPAVSRGGPEDGADAADGGSGGGGGEPFEDPVGAARLQCDMLHQLVAANRTLPAARSLLQRGGCTASVLHLDVPDAQTADVLLEVHAGVGRRAEPFNAHRAVLQARSAYFKEAVDAAVQRGGRSTALVCLRIDFPALLGPGVPAADAGATMFHLLAYLYGAAHPPRQALHPVAAAAHALRVEPLAELCDALLLRVAQSPSECCGALREAHEWGRADLAEEALQTIAASWQRIGPGFPWDSLPKVLIMRVIQTVKQHTLASPTASG